jgi:heme/copper-type cytochrome/quinol oxidase subunit 2
MRLDTLLSHRVRKYLPFAAVVVGILAIPTLVWAVPGSGEFVAVESSSGEQITQLYNIIAKICLGILIVVEGALLYAIIKFRRTSEDEDPEAVHGNFQLEVGWTLAALAIQVFIGWKSVDVMFEVETDPTTVQDRSNPELLIEAISWQWDWQFRYPTQTFNGEKFETFTSDNLVVPANTKVELNVTSRDVLHSLYVPALGVKIDAVPGRFNYWWFSAEGPTSLPEVGSPAKNKKQRKLYDTTQSDFPDLMPDTILPTESPYTETTEGGYQQVDFLGSIDTPEKSPYRKYNAVEYAGMCTELCGKGHWDMYFRTVAMTRSSFSQWIDDQKNPSSVETDGEKLYQAQCQTCHGEQGKGNPPNYPPLHDTKWTDSSVGGDEITIEDHVEVVLMGSNAESLKGPTQVKGVTYNNDRMTYSGQNRGLYDEQVAALVNYERQKKWGNDGKTISAEEVAKIRKELGYASKPAPKPGQVARDDLMAEGKKLYAGACASCHGDDGQNGPDIPNMAGNPAVTGGSAKSLASTLIEGQDTDKWPGFQSPVGRDMSNRELAAVLTYIRRSWGNEASAIQPPEIQKVREQLDGAAP